MLLNTSTDASLNEPLLKRKQTAKILSVHPQTVARWEREGRIHALRLSGRSVRYHRSEIERILREATVYREGVMK